MAKPYRKATQLSSHRAEKAFNKKFDAKPPVKKIKKED